MDARDEILAKTRALMLAEEESGDNESDPFAELTDDEEELENNEVVIDDA